MKLAVSQMTIFHKIAGGPLLHISQSVWDQVHDGVEDPVFLRVDDLVWDQIAVQVKIEMQKQEGINATD